MYSLIRDDESDHLQNYIQQKSVEGVAQFNFEGIDYDEEVLQLTEDKTITTSILNPILLAVNYRSL